jgi:glucosamine--fructose-6-phosphate aminotransferase (isomerizing)
VSLPGFPSPLLGQNSILDQHSQAIIQKAYEAEWARSQELPTDDPLDVNRRKRVELTWGEMWSQPEVIQTTLKLEKEAIIETARHFSKLEIDRIFMTGCGDSIASMIAVRTLFEQLLRIPCEPIQALDLAYYYHSPVNERTLVIALSSSGETTRTIEAMLLARALGAHILALSNTPGSTMMRETERGIIIHAERRGWPTQSSTAAMATMVQLVLEMVRIRGDSRSQIKQFESEFSEIPAQMKTVLLSTQEAIQKVAEQEVKRSVYLYCGGGPAYASALFGAAKVKECSPNHGIAIPLEEFHHYNSQKAGDPLFLLAPKGASIPRAVDTLKEGKRWGGQVYCLTSEFEAHLFQGADQVIPLPDVSEVFAAFVYTIPVQLFAYYVAMEKFRSAERNYLGKE